MTDYIKREDALKAVDDIVCDADDAERTCDRIIDIPIADVAPVRHGRWIITETPTNEYCNCSVCGTQVMSDEAWNYCPNCGARMDGESDE